MMKTHASGRATAIFCNSVVTFSLLAHSIKSTPPPYRPGSHVLVTSTAATPTTKKPELPITTTATPVTDMAAAIIASATDGIESANEEEAGETEPFVHSFVVQSDIKFRYSRTKITSAIVNPHRNQSHEYSFNVTLPQNAYIVQFSMTVDERVYEAYVHDRESAAETYAQEKSKGKSTGVVQAENTQNAQRFAVLANVKASSAVTFTLTHEELLERKYGHYEQVIHIESEEARNTGIIVSIADTKNITMLKAIGRQNRDDNDEPITGVGIDVGGSYGMLAWAMNATLNETTRKMPERFIVQYDLKHHAGAGKIIVQDGYFVHFCTPEAAEPEGYPKHVTFVLDISGSMWGNKIRQLRETMAKILKVLLYNYQRDYFSIITFSSDAKVWKVGGSSGGVYPVTTGNIEKATAFTNSLEAEGGTNIQGALTLAFNVAANGPKQQSADPIIVLLTDGYGNRPAAETRAHINVLNKGRAVSIHSVAFGKYADNGSLKLLSLLNKGTARYIYEDADAALQLENFYSEISSPVLNGVTFSYTSDQYSVSDVTRRKFSKIFKGTELVVAGRLRALRRSKAVEQQWSYDASQTAVNQTKPTPALRVQVIGQSLNVTEVFTQPDFNVHDAPISQSLFTDEEEESFMERLWAYLTVKQLLEDAQDDANFQAATGGGTAVTYPQGEDPTVRARDIAVEYNFVTPLTFLVLVMPDAGEVDIGQRDTVVLKIKPQVQTSEPGVKNVDPLEQISWLSRDDVSVVISRPPGTYIVARDNSGANALPIPGNGCGSQKSCTHLKDCIQPIFLKSLAVYERQYFCGLRSLMPDPILYAGVCCPIIPTG